MCKTIYNTTQHLECYIKMINSLIILTLICNILNDITEKIRIHFKCITLNATLYMNPLFMNNTYHNLAVRRDNYVFLQLSIDNGEEISKTIHRQSVRNIL